MGGRCCVRRGHTQQIGISLEEAAHRMRSSDVHYITNVYPQERSQLSFLDEREGMCGV